MVLHRERRGHPCRWTGPVRNAARARKTSRWCRS